MTKRTAFFALAFILFLSPLAMASQFQLRTPHSELKLKQMPEKIAVYDLALLDTFNALNIDADIIPDFNYEGRLAHYDDAKYIKAGSLSEPDFQTLKKLDPDLIFIGPKASVQTEAFTQIAPTVFMPNDTQHFLDNLAVHTQSLAQAFHREELAQQKLKTIQQQHQILQAKTQHQSALMLYAVSDHFIPQAEHDRFGFVYDLTGLASVVTETATWKHRHHPASLNNTEAISRLKQSDKALRKALKLEPDYIFVLDRGAVNTQKYASKDAFIKNKLLANARAFKNNKVIYLDADTWYSIGAGLGNTEQMLNELIDKIQ